VKIKPMTKYRALLRATVLDECRKRKTSREIADAFQTRHRRAIAAVTADLVTAQIIKHIDGIKHIGRKRADSQQLELFEQMVANVIPFHTIKNGKRRVERCELGALTLNELTAEIAYRKSRPPRQSEPLDDYIALRDQLAPFASGETTIAVAYGALKEAQKKA
jgi:hypothetical protein